MSARRCDTPEFPERDRSEFPELTDGANATLTKNLTNALRVIEDERQTLALAKIRDRVRHRDVLLNGLETTFIKAITGNTDPVDVAVLRHFIWQVKRKLMGMKVTRHLMPIFLGGQDKGKTTALKFLFGPVEDLVDYPAHLQLLTDDREQFRLVRSFIIFCDEMAKAETTVVEILKNRLTAEHIRYRLLGFNRIQTGTNNATFIGASNKPVTDLILDPTGMRRFYEVKCAGSLDWDVINHLDYLSLWQSVDESGPPPIEAVLDELRRRQEALRVPDAVEDFLQRRCIIGKGSIGGEELFAEYIADLGAEGRKGNGGFGSKRFGQRAKQLVGPENWKKSNGVWYTVTVRGRSGRPQAEAARFQASKTHPV